MVKAAYNIPMEPFIQANLNKTQYLALEFHQANFISMKVNGKVEKCMETESAHGLMEIVKL